jgi:ADP-ribose pyrophosphatase YjhB (NUDIX family)
VLTRYAYKVANTLRKAYWFVFRPRTFGVKCVLEHDGRWLMIRNTYGPAPWTFPGGAIDRGETPEEAAKREIAEEVGITVGGLRAIGDYYSTRQHKRDTVYCFAASVESAEHDINAAEVAEARWFAPTEIPSSHAMSVDRIMAMMERR